MAVFFRWQIICYLCAGLTISNLDDADRIYHISDYRIYFWTDNIK